MSLYPSLEDMKVDQMARAQSNLQQQWQQQQLPSAPESLPYPLQPPVSESKYSNLYPILDDYMGLSVTPESVAALVPNAVSIPHSNPVKRPVSETSNMVAPLSSQSLGLARAEVTHGIREVILCKDEKNMVGLRVQSVNKGVFVALVHANTPAAMAGLRFGDQILMINDVSMAGFSVDKVHDFIKKAPAERITMAVRDRPFERTVTMHKDSIGHVGFLFKNGKIISIVKDSSAARNGLLIDHQLLEVNGQNVVGLKDKEITRILEGGGQIITVTVMPSFIYDHMMKHMASSLVKKLMDHSVPSV